MYFNRIFLIVNEACDSRCVLCDYWLIKKPRFMEASFVEQRIARFVEENDIGVVCVSGGEPTVHPEIGRMLRALHQTGTSVTLTTSTTNLSMCFDDIKASVDNYLISLDGIDRASYIKSRGVDHFDVCIEWIKKIKQETTSQVAISCVLQKSNLHLVKGMYDLCVGLGIHRLFFRVPDIKSGVFGRRGGARGPTSAQIKVTTGQVAYLREQMEGVINIDQRNRILGQSKYNLQRKIKFFECHAANAEYMEDDKICDVPLTSFVIEVDGSSKPCFYLPQKQEYSDAPASGLAFEDVYHRMISDEEFRKTWCNSCQQFDGHKHDLQDVGHG